MDPQDVQPHAEDRALREEEKEGLLQAVRGLPLIYREIVLLALEGLDYREISEVIGISESNVGARLSRARQQLRQILEVRREQRC